ncbi:DUF2971 domain-containing protein [Vibrio hepatarius]|uniref:DUF2971 domain-containing protein n=1 Tax=Vibrio hepatarius TaxID=171383 RepID=UPI001C09EFCA|nr:DUF2971 domain-containing protein [Vibrio hepatarius]MBU2898266.1 DUF2971 domain-containing protein [Vibrio hepatarius]
MGKVGRKIKMKKVRRSLRDDMNIADKLPPLYKYLCVEGAHLTLGNRTFKFAKPSDFNDLEDLTVKSVFEGDLEAELSKMPVIIPEFILNNLNSPITCSSTMKEKLTELQSMLKLCPELLDEIKGSPPDKRGAEASKKIAEDFINELNESMQDYRVFCVTTNLNSDYMWQNYAEDHKGIALRIEPNIEKESKFQLFEPVTYREHRPALYAGAQMFIESAFFGDKEELAREKLKEIIHTKTMEWRWENEYRLAIPLLGEEPWNTLLFHHEEITELHLGAEVEEDFKESVIGLAHSINPDISIFQVQRSPKGELYSEAIK